MKKRKKNKIVSLSILIYGVILLFGCDGKRASLERIISGTDYKLWQKQDTAAANRGTSTYFYFNRKGDFQIYKSYRKSKVMEKADYGDVEFEKSWKLIGSDSINIGGEHFRINKINDSLIVCDRGLVLKYKGNKLNTAK